MKPWGGGHLKGFTTELQASANNSDHVKPIFERLTRCFRVSSVYAWWPFFVYSIATVPLFLGFMTPGFVASIKHHASTTGNGGTGITALFDWTLVREALGIVPFIIGFPILLFLVPPLLLFPFRRLHRTAFPVATFKIPPNDEANDHAKSMRNYMAALVPVLYGIGFAIGGIVL